METVPPVMVVDPVKRLLPPSVSVPAPALVRLPEPALPIELASVTSLPLVLIVAPLAPTVSVLVEMSSVLPLA